jgi:hypothetical protein
LTARGIRVTGAGTYACSKISDLVYAVSGIKNAPRKCHQIDPSDASRPYRAIVEIESVYIDVDPHRSPLTTKAAGTFVPHGL